MVSLSTSHLAMAIDDNMMEGVVSSSGTSEREFEQDSSVLSVSEEDFAWADSCLTKDPEIIESGWNSFKDALLETIYEEPKSSADENENSFNEAYISNSQEAVDIQNRSKTALDTSPCNEEADPTVDYYSNYENGDDFWSRYSENEIFLPTYNENMKDLGPFDPELDFAFQASEVDQSTENIFKIWDLNIPPEEDDLGKQLDKALAESSLETTPPDSDDYKALKDLKDESLDDLISAIADLSLSPSLG